MAVDRYRVEKDILDNAHRGGDRGRFEGSTTPDALRSRPFRLSTRLVMTSINGRLTLTDKLTIWGHRMHRAIQKIRL